MSQRLFKGLIRTDCCMHSPKAQKKNQNRRPQGEISTLRGEYAEKVIEARQALWKGHNNVTPYLSTTTFFASRSKGTKWYEEQQESSYVHCSELGSSEERAGSLARSARRARQEPNYFVALVPPSNNWGRNGGRSKGLIQELNRFLRQGKREDRNCRNRKGKKDNDVDCYIDIIATIIGGIDDKELNIATAMVRGIFVGIESSIDVITLEFLKTYNIMRMI
ncbi:hypothetical protein Cgig2_034104 [Carnegiea gigantea]|uniref:Uncharacterized protein n=1 Tax=Carnegiea gigantea TaxID=171969 RepID=A0A9Q1GHQ7_9CARY|nr:hypothetical protein Cgig2_034104 [Carnegiea gigantea]